MRHLAVFVAVVGVVGTLVSADGDWEVDRESASLSLNDVSVVNDTLSWAVGDDGLIVRRTHTGWVLDSLLIAHLGSLARSDLKGIFFWDERHGWIVGNTKPGGSEGRRTRGVVLRTVDGGQTWDVRFPFVPEGGDLLKVGFGSRYWGWLVAENGYMLLTPDGGITWTPTYVGGRADSLHHAWSDGIRR